MHTPEWLEDEAPGGRNRRPVLIAVAAAPWLLVVGLLVGTGNEGDGPDTPVAAGSHVEAGDGAHDPGRGAADVAAPSVPDDPAATMTPPGSGASEAEVAPPPTGTAPDSAAPDAIDGDAAVTSPFPPPPIALQHLELDDPVLDEASAMAVVVADAWLGGEPRRLVVESVARTSSRTAVAAVTAIGDDGVQRFGVPLALTDDGPAPTATPYPLTPPIDEPVDPPPLEEVDDPTVHAAVASAIAEAGFGDLTVDAVYTAEGWPLLADVRDRDGDERPTVWVTDAGGEVTVAAGRDLPPITVYLDENGEIAEVWGYDQ